MPGTYPWCTQSRSDTNHTQKGSFTPPCLRWDKRMINWWAELVNYGIILSVEFVRQDFFEHLQRIPLKSHKIQRTFFLFFFPPFWGLDFLILYSRVIEIPSNLSGWEIYFPILIFWGPNECQLSHQLNSEGPSQLGTISVILGTKLGIFHLPPCR